MALENDDIPVSVDVSFGEVLQGTLEINGALSFVDDAVQFVYQTKSFFKRKAGTQTVRIPLEGIREIEFKGNMFSGKVVILPRRLQLMEDMPGESRDQMIFKLKHKKHHPLAKNLVSYVQYRIFETGNASQASIPFTLGSTDLGLTEHAGLIYLEDEFLVFEIQSGISGGRKSDRQVIKIETKALRTIEISQGMRTDKLSVYPKKSALLDAVPGDHREKVVLNVPKRYRDQLEKLTGKVLEGATEEHEDL